MPRRQAAEGRLLAAEACAFAPLLTQAFGVKHLGVVSALQREKLLPRIIAGTSAGSIVAAAVCSRRDDELRELLDVTGPAILETLKFCEQSARPNSRCSPAHSSCATAAHQSARGVSSRGPTLSSARRRLPRCLAS